MAPAVFRPGLRAPFCCAPPMPGLVTPEWTKVLIRLGEVRSWMGVAWTAWGVKAPAETPDSEAGRNGEAGAGPNLAVKACWWATGVWIQGGIMA